SNQITSKLIFPKINLLNHRKRYSNLMETLKHSNNNNLTSICASTDPSLSGQVGTDGANYFNSSIQSAQTIQSINHHASLKSKNLSSTTLDRNFSYWP
ncbi:hypothetical protein O181_056506, partial [Austropuccinia psidii MF-1]|nr:hypothetical protein [Austropuccinia psidii MF-1]